MAKRKRTKNDLAEAIYEVDTEGKATESVEQSGVGVEGPREEPKMVVGLVPEGEVEELAPVAVAEVADVEGLDAGPFWSLLIRAGYQMW